MRRRLTPKEFIDAARKIHGDAYKYDKVQYVHSQVKVPIECKIHGEFLQSPQKHLAGQGCPQCKFQKSASKQSLTLQEFVERARSIHHDKYDYSKVNYKNNHTKVVIACPVHGDFEMLPSNHTHGRIPQGCPSCSGRTQWTKSSFIEAATKLHAGKYTYYKTDYASTAVPVIIICPLHGEFLQKPSKHLAGQGCPICAGTKKKTTEQFVEKARTIHGEKYDYTDAVYTTNHKKVRIICPEHGTFEMTPANHTHRSKPQGCPKCSGRRIQTTADFVEASLEVHEGFYSYALTEYIDSRTPITIICPFHGEFRQKPQVHLMGSGCSRCRSPKGEHRIETVLKQLGVEYENQYSFPDCRYKNPLFFDFRIDRNGAVGLIEYNGEQHYRSIKDSPFDLSEIVARDNIKRHYCKKNGLPLLEIRFDEFDSIDEKITKFLEELESRV